MKRMVFLLAIMCFISSAVSAGTVAYWRFEAGPADSDVIHTGDNGVYYPDITDVSGNENHLSVWGTGGHFAYRSDVAFSEVPQTGQANTLSVKSVGGNPAMWCSTSQMQTMTPAAFSIEATFKVQNDHYRTLIGRDSRGSNTEGDGANPKNAAFYIQTMPYNKLAVKFCDVSGYWHVAATGDNAFSGYNSGDDPEGTNAPWYSVAAVSDGSLLSLYLFNHDNPRTGYQLIAQTDMTLSGSPDTALTAGAGDGGDWDAGDWAVGRGMWDGRHADRWYGFIDEVRISDVALDPSDFLLGPIPYNQHVNQVPDLANGDVDVTLSWNAAGDSNPANGNSAHVDIVDQYVFIGMPDSADPNLFYVGATGVDPGENPASSFVTDLQFDTVYQWVVVAAMDGYEQSFTALNTIEDVDPNNITGPIWTFDSMPSAPIITDGPVGASAPAGGMVEYSVSVDSVTAVSYAWYKSDDQANDTPEDDLYITDTAVIVLSDLTLNDEGFYYCVVSNESAATDISETAFLEIERLMAWYEFENDITDSENDFDGKLIKSDPNFPLDYITEGMVNNAVILDGIEEAVEIFRSIQNGMTIELWVKTTAQADNNDGWWNGDGLVDGEVYGSANDFGAVLYGSKFAFGVGDPSGSSLTISSDTDINDDRWHYCVATRDHVTGEIAVYVDGRQESSGIAPLGTKDAPQALRIGSLLVDQNFLAGQIDEVKLYNYPLDELTVAANYNAISGEFVCVRSKKPDAKYDLNGDCIVDLADFSEMAGVWLDCGLYPGCVQ